MKIFHWWKNENSLSHGTSKLGPSLIPICISIKFCWLLTKAGNGKKLKAESWVFLIWVAILLKKVTSVVIQLARIVWKVLCEEDSYLKLEYWDFLCRILFMTFTIVLWDFYFQTAGVVYFFSHSLSLLLWGFEQWF